MRGSTLIESSWKTVDGLVLVRSPVLPHPAPALARRIARRGRRRNGPAERHAGARTIRSRTRAYGTRVIDVSIDGPVPGCLEAARVGVGLHLLPRWRGGWSHMTAYTDVSTAMDLRRIRPIPRGGPIADAERELVDIPAVEVISRAAVLLMSAAAEQLGLAVGRSRPRRSTATWTRPAR